MRVESSLPILVSVEQQAGDSSLNQLSQTFTRMDSLSHLYERRDTEIFGIIVTLTGARQGML